MAKRLGSFLRDERIKEGLTQRQASECLGLKSAQYISNFERGVCEPSLDSAIKLAQLYKIAPADLYEVALHDYKEHLQRKILYRSTKRRA